jgi:hypothetical protein
MQAHALFEAIGIPAGADGFEVWDKKRFVYRFPEAKAPNVVFVTKWDADRRRFVALDDAGVLLGLSPTQGVAMGIARTAAIKEAEVRRCRITVVVEDENGKRKKHWTFAPPSKHIPRAKGHGD